jgi:glycerophosphoryl diester phosphodiesterase
MHPFETDDLPDVVGHRGAPRRAPENTPEAFAAAAEEGATWVELDARLSADGTVVVVHDPLSPDGVPVIRQSAEALLRVHGICGLEAVLAALPPGLGVDVECKNLPGQPDFDEDERLAAAVADVLRPHVGTRPLLTTSFNPMTVAALAVALDDVPAGLLHVDTIDVPSALEVAREVGARVICPHEAVPLGAAEVAAAHAAGCAVLSWTVDDPDRARELAAAGVDAICTNDPAGILAALR